MVFEKIIKSLGLGLVATLSINAFAQQNAESAHNSMHEDLIASQMNIKEQIKLNETKEFMDVLMNEEPEPELDLDIYSKCWNSQSVNPYAGMAVPDHVKIDVSEYHMPVPGCVNSPYGYRPRFRRMHKGVDLHLCTGDTVRAAFSGKVRLTKFERRGYGYYVILRHPNGLETIYGHLSRFLVKPDQVVKAGDPIALGGSTGRSTGPHLHFETRFMGYPINPSAIFDFANQTTHTDTYTFTKATYKDSRNYSPRSKEQYVNKASQKTNKYASKSKGTRTYKVRSGDSLGKIAARNGTTVQKLCKLNGLSTKSVLRPGTRLKIR